MLVGGDTYTHMAGEYRGNSADDSALDSLQRVSAAASGSRLMLRIETAGNVQQAVTAREASSTVTQSRRSGKASA